MRFLHTGDWQLGMRRHFLSGEAQARYDEARLEALRSMARLADDEGCAFVVVAGDVFESNFVDRKVLLRALEALRAYHVPVYLLPGNHDALDASSLYRSGAFRDHQPSCVKVLETHEPVMVPGVADPVEVVGVPWRTRRPSKDLVAEVCASLAPPAGLRVLVAHGQVDALSPDAADPSLIGLSGLEARIREGLLHYAAIGDRHSVTEVGSTGKVWYAGTPLVTDFDEQAPNRALVVTLDRGRAEVEERRVGSWSFVRRTLEVDADGVDQVAEFLDGLPDKACTVVELGLRGTVGLGAKARLDELLDRFSELFAALWVSESRSDLAVLPDQADLDELGLVGFAAETLEELRNRAAGGEEAAADALGLLYRLAREGRPRAGSGGPRAAGWAP